MNERDLGGRAATARPDAFSDFLALDRSLPRRCPPKGIPLAVVPARNEVVRLPKALAALRRSGVATIVVANGCSDETADVARAHGACVIETPRLEGGVGEARQIGMLEALSRNPRWVLTTDADCTLGSRTIPAIEDALSRADVVFGRVVPDAKEFAALPYAVRVHGMLEQRHQDLLAEIDARVAPTPWNPIPCHNQSPGALIAFRPDAYRAIGGFLPVPCHEDRAIAGALARSGARIARPFDAVVHASCRLVGRAHGGMASTIAARTRTDLHDAIAALLEGCAAAEHRLATLRGRDATKTIPDAANGAHHVLPFVQASV